MKILAVASFALVLLAACGSTDLGSILGGGSPSESQSTYELRGRVDSVDLNSRSIYLTNVSGSQSNLGGGNTARVYFDDKTPVEYQGRQYTPQDLERGDEIAVRAYESGNRLLAERISVTYNVAGSGSTSGSTSGGLYGSDLRGTVTFVDSSRRTIEIDRGSGSRTTVEYDANTPVRYSGRTYGVADLKRGDEIEITTRDLGSGRILAQDINVVRSVSMGSGSTYPGTTQPAVSTVRGTVRFHDVNRRTIELETVSWYSSSFQPAPGGSTGSNLIVQYGANTGVEVSGRVQPISGLERGDIVDVQLQDPRATTPLATRIVLVQDVRR